MSDEELIYLVVAAIQDSNLGHCHETERCGHEWGHTKDAAEAVLAALVGRLLPPVVSEEVRWRVVGIPGHGFPPYRYDWGTDEAAARKWMEKVLGRDGDWFDGPTLKTRTIRTLADDSVITSPWCEVSP